MKSKVLLTLPVVALLLFFTFSRGGIFTTI